MNRIIKEPLVHFLLIGGFLFLLDAFFNKEDNLSEEYQIYLDQSDINRLQAAYQKNWGQLPNNDQLNALIEEEIKSEIYYREALRMQLDHNDEIIRRRLRQKYEFLTKDLKDQEIPSEEDLISFYKDNPAYYQSPKKVSFSHIYFSPDLRKQAKRDARQLIQSISNIKEEAIKDLGDPFHLASFYGEKDIADVRQLFGKAFADSLFQIDQLSWTGPISSGYGEHLVNISHIKPKTLLPFQQVKEKVIEDWKNTSYNSFNEQLFEALRNQYQVHLDFEIN